MANSDTEKEKPKKRRLTLHDTAAVRNSLCRLMRLRYNGQIDSALFRDLCYSFNVLLGIDKHILESDLNKRIEQLEQLVRGEGGTVIDSKEIESPYAQNLKRQLANESKINSDLNNEILNLKRQLAKSRAAPADMQSVGAA